MKAFRLESRGGPLPNIGDPACRVRLKKARAVGDQ